MSFDFLPPLAPCPRLSPRTHPYQPSLSSSASSSQSSVFSVDVSSQSSSQSSQSSTSDSVPQTWDQYELRTSTACSAVGHPTFVKQVVSQPSANTCMAPVAAEQRQNPRRCSVSSSRPPPALVRQSERKGQFVDCLVDSATQMVEVIWPTSVPACRGDSGKGVLPLRTFIQETLRRSRTSFSTLQVALYYLILIKAHVPRYDFTMEQPEDTPACRALQCGRRMFLAALILASKYLQDRNYSARAWSKISGLKVCEINTNEMAFLGAVNWKLHLAESLFDRWQEIILRYTPSQQPPSPGAGSADARWTQWRLLVSRLEPDLEGVDIPKPVRLCGQVRKASTWPMPPPSPATPTTPTPTSIPSTSQESTPTPASVHNLPRYLEPRLDMRPPTPARLGPLPTPSMTPQSVTSGSCMSTPAASVFNAPGGVRRPSMCSAMQAAQTLLATRMSDSWSCSRRPSLAPSTTSTMSMNSSPESMTSDASSRSSRASSISSASSHASNTSAQACNAMPVKLARLATLRCAGLPMKPVERIALEPEIIDVDSEPIVSSPDFDSFHIHDIDTPNASLPDEMVHLARVQSGKSYCSASSTGSIESGSSPLRSAMSSSPEDMRPSSVFADLVKHQQYYGKEFPAHQPNRKRGRSSVDMSLHQNVRDLLVPETRAARHNCLAKGEVRMDDTTDAEAFLLVQSPTGTPCTDKRLPVKVMKDGRKRACCASEAQVPIRQGVGMWEGVL